MKNNILNDMFKVHSCTGCSICSISCPQKAIEIKLSKEGFYEPIIIEELCTDCGICKKSCYKFDNNVLDTNDIECITYSAINKDTDELKTVTSGGVSSELMKQCIKEGYKVLGVAYDYEKNIAITKVASSIEELVQFKGSKYFQSFTVDAFHKALNDKTEQKYAVFGTPCQIYAISKYVNPAKIKEGFLLIDIFCHGCPSLNLWIKYLEYNKKKFGVLKFDRIAFRSKTYGWHEYSTTFYNNKNIFNSSKINDPFYTLFFDKNALNDACYTCKQRSTLAYTDIRIGDFWGHQYDMNTQGVSAVVLATAKGKNLLDKIKSKFKISEHTFSEAIMAQSYGKEHDYNEYVRNKTLELLSSNMLMEEVVDADKKNYSFKKKLKIRTKNVMKRLPRKVYLIIKKMVHEC